MVAIGTVVVMFSLTLLATLGNEPAPKNENVVRAREMSFKEAIQQIALADQQVRLFFIIIMFTIP